MRRPALARTAAAWAVATLAFAATSFWFGRQTGLTSVGDRLVVLQERVDSLTEENTKITTLAARMQELETNYERVRAVMGGEVVPSARDILLPPVQSDGERIPGRQVARTGPSLWPLVESSFVTRSFGDSVPGEGPHAGLDIAVPVGSYVRASGDGVVVEASDDRQYGKYVSIEHADNIRSLYAHNSWTFVTRGDSVEAGEVIALSGNTGRSTAPHLHLEIRRGDTEVDPLPFVSARP